MIGFVAILTVFVIGFNKQMLAKHKKRQEESEERHNKQNKDKDKTDD